MSTKVLLDTDIGSDVDDALCLAYLLARADCDLLGITTVTGHGLERAKLASVLCRRAGRDVPIVVGAEQPLLLRQHQVDAEQAVILDRWPHDGDFPQQPAIEFLRRAIRQHPNEVVLLTIGPLTNIALLFSVDPEIPSLLKGLVTMGGSYQRGPYSEREWNFVLDPHAAAIVYRARPPYHCSVGLDVTTQVQMDAALVRRRLRAEVLEPVVECAEVFFHKTETVTFHDPLAGAVIFDEEICSFETGLVKVELARGKELGRVHWMPRDDGPHQVAVAVDAARFFDHYLAILEHGGPKD